MAAEPRHPPVQFALFVATLIAAVLLPIFMSNKFIASVFVGPTLEELSKLFIVILWGRTSPLLAASVFGLTEGALKLVAIINRPEARATLDFFLVLISGALSVTFFHVATGRSYLRVATAGQLAIGLQYLANTALHCAMNSVSQLIPVDETKTLEEAVLALMPWLLLGCVTAVTAGLLSLLLAARIAKRNEIL